MAEGRRAGAPGRRPRGPLWLGRAFLMICGAGVLALAGCASPGEPTPPKPVVPSAVVDLTARQEGSSVVLAFSLPTRSVRLRPLQRRPSVEIYRDFEPAGTPAEAPRAPNRLLLIVPSVLVDSHVREGQARFLDNLTPEDFAVHTGQRAVYMVRTRASKKESADSNLAAVRIYPAFLPVTDLKVRVTQAAIVLSWSAPEKVVAGTPTRIEDYRVYRAEAAPGEEAQAASNLSAVRPQAPLTFLGTTDTPNFRDTRFEFGRTYLYSVRSVAQFESAEVESADSSFAVVTPRDTFPPAAPQGLIGIYVPGTNGLPAHVDLSWAISPEPDVAGYNVYRSDLEGALGKRRNAELLPTPTFRDMSIVPGREYFYAVTAVDRAGNESPASASVSAGVPNGTKTERP